MSSKGSFCAVLAVIGGLGFGAARAAAQAAPLPLRVLSSNGVKAVVEELRSPIEKVAGGPLVVTFGTSASIRQRIASGEAFDVAILTTDVIDELTKAGAIDGDSRTSLGSSRIGVGVRAGWATPDIRDADALKHVLLAVRSLTYASDGASRPAITRMLDTLGITGAMEPKTILEQGSVRAAARVVRGDAEMVITLISEIVPIPGLELAGPLPEEFQRYVSFAAGVGSKAQNREAARSLVAFLSAPSARPTFTAKGIDPGSSSK